MDKIEIDRSEYQDLISLKTDVVKLQAIEAKFKEMESDLEKKDNEITELKKETEAHKKEKEVALLKEATDFVSGLIQDGKLLPKYKEDKIADYISKSTDEEKLSLFKEDLTNRDKIINFGELGGLEKGTNAGTVDLKEATNDEIQEAIEAKMKRDDSDWPTAAKALGLEV